MNENIAAMLNLHQYQKDMVDFVVQHPKCGLFLQMGLGKSRITLAAIMELNPPCHVLIIAPINIARSSWIEEIKKTGAPIRYKSLIVNEKGTPLIKKKRYALYEEAKTAPPTLYFINRELTADLVNYYQHSDNAYGTDWPFPFIVIDELQSFKNYSSQRFESLMPICGYRTRRGDVIMDPITQTPRQTPCIRFIGLTGTPVPNGLMDLWSQIYLMDGGDRLGYNISRYRDTFFNEGKKIDNRVIEWIPKFEYRLNEYNQQYLFDGKKEIYKRISDIVVSMDNTDHIKLPDVSYNTIYAYMKDAEIDLYKTLMKEKVLTLDGVEQEITAANSAVLTTKLSQMASGNLYTDKEHNYVEIHKAKLEQLEYIYDNEPTPLLVAYHFQTDLNAILGHKKFKDAVKFDGSLEMREAWNQGKIRMLLIQPASAGFGLNFQQGGHVLVWYTPTWSLEEYLQTNARLYRQGQQYPVTIHHIVTKGTVDEKILKGLSRKDMSQQTLLDAVEYATHTNNFY